MIVNKRCALRFRCDRGVKQFPQRSQRLRSVRNLCSDRRKEPKPVFFFNNGHVLAGTTKHERTGQQIVLSYKMAMTILDALWLMPLVFAHILITETITVETKFPETQ